MADNDFPKLITAFVLITLFMFLIIGFATQLADNYSHIQNETDSLEEQLGSSSITDTIDNTRSTAEGWKETFSEFGKGNIFEKIVDILGFLTVGMFKLVIAMISFVIAPFNIIGSMLVNVLGVPVIVVNIIWVLVILAIIFGIWRLTKIGQ